MADRALQAERETIRLALYQEDPVGVSRTGSVSTFGQGQQFVNCIPQFEINPVTKEGTAIIQKRPGIKATSLTPLLAAYFTGTTSHPKDNIVITQLADVNCCAINDFDAGLTRIFQYLPATGSVTEIGSIVADPKDWCQLSELNVGGVATLGVVWTKYDKSESKCYYATAVAGSFPAASLTQIVDADFPDQLGTPMVCTGRFVQLDFTTYILTTSGYLYNSDQYSITSWNADGNLQTYAYPDKGIGLIRYKNHIVAFSEDSVEFFNDAGKKPPGSPLERTQQAFIKFGCVDSQCMINVDDHLYWIASGSSATDGLWKLEGYTPTKVSNPHIDLQISDAYNSSFGSYLIHLRSLSMAGMTHILITFVRGTTNVMISSEIVANEDDTNPITGEGSDYNQIVYCTEYGTWWSIFDHSWITLGINILGWLPCAYNPIPGGAIQNKYLQFILKFDGYNNNFLPAIYTIESTDTWSYYQDQTSDGGEENQTMVQATIQMRPLEFQTLKRKFIHKASISMEPISTAGTVGDSWIYLGYSKSEGVNADTIFRNCKMNPSTVRHSINRLGQVRTVQFALANKSNIAWTVRALELDVSQGTA